jgi:acyl carrier protein
MAFEEAFSTEGQAVEISDDDAGSIKTIQDAVDYLKTKGASDE